MDIGALGSGFDDLPGAHTVDGLPSTIRAELSGEEQRLVILQVVLAGPQQQLLWQTGVCGREMCRLDGATRVLEVGQHQPLPADVPGSQRQGFADAGPGGPERGEQQSVALAGGGPDDRLDVLGRQPLGWLPAPDAGLPERRLGAEPNSSCWFTGTSAVLREASRRLFMGGQFNCPLVRSSSPAVPQPDCTYV